MCHRYPYLLIPTHRISSHIIWSHFYTLLRMDRSARPSAIATTSSTRTTTAVPSPPSPRSPCSPKTFRPANTRIPIPAECGPSGRWRGGESSSPAGSCWRSTGGAIPGCDGCWRSGRRTRPRPSGAGRPRAVPSPPRRCSSSIRRWPLEPVPEVATARAATAQVATTTASQGRSLPPIITTREALPVQVVRRVA